MPSLAATRERPILIQNYDGREYIVAGNNAFMSADEKRSIALFMGKGDVFVDIGAHVGCWTIPGSFVYKKVHAFEGNSIVFECLRDNLGINGIKNVKTYNVLLSDQEHHVAYDGWQIKPGVGEDQAFSLDSFEIGSVDFIKIDVEGHELEVLRGAQHTIMTSKPRMMIEVHKNFGVSLDSVFEAVLKIDRAYLGTVVWYPHYAHVLFEIRSQ